MTTTDPPEPIDLKPNVDGDADEISPYNTVKPTAVPNIVSVPGVSPTGPNVERTAPNPAGTR